MSFLKKFFTKKRIIYGGIILCLIIILIMSFGNGNGEAKIAVVRGDVVAEVSATGKVKPNQAVDLGFDKSGRVARVYKDVGSEVKKGEIIASLEAGEVSADLAKAQALLQEENSKLRTIQNTAPTTYSDAYKNLQAAINKGFAVADNAVRNKADFFFKTPEENPRFEASFNDGNFVHYFDVPSDKKIDVNSRRKQIESILDDWQSQMGNVNNTNAPEVANRAIENLNTISTFLDRMANIINSFSTPEYGYEATVDNYKAMISTARSEVSEAISSVVTAKDKLNSAPTPGSQGAFEDVLAEEAKVKQAEAAVNSLQASLSKFSILAPFDGVITKQDAKQGQAVSPGDTLVALSSLNQMYIEANISEIHIGKIAVGDPASVTFDAFPGEVFSGSVSFIEPGDILVDGVVNYKIRVELINPDARIKSGLTSNIKIETERKTGVLSLPQYAITKEEDKSYVNKLVGKKVEKVPVNLGLSGNNGVVEIVGGLSEGDMVEF